MTLPSPLIFIPKKVTQDVDFAPQLKQTIHKSYSEDPESYSDELSQLNRTRQDALRGSAGSDATARDLLYKYFGQLELLELRFPDLRVPFLWADAFTHVKISQQSLAYEKASVIFNIGATLSALAASSPRSAPEGLKRAFHSFRSAAGMFVYINENFLHAPSTDLSKDVVKLLVGLTEAQATEVFIETMGPATGKSAGLRSKLCMQASAAYAAIVEDVKEWVTKGVFLREWSLLIQAKAKYFSSLAHYHRSVADTAASKYGEALSRLSISESLAKEAHRLAQSFLSSFSTSSTSTSLSADAPVALSEMTKTHLTLVSEARTKAQKDNDIVYNEVVPSEASLPAIEPGKPVAAPIPIHEVYATPTVQALVGPDLFQRLVPLSVHESASLYSEEKAKLVRSEAERVELADEELASALEYMGLPASLARFQSGAAAQASLVDPGPQVRGWADEVRAGESGSASSSSSLHGIDPAPSGRVEDLFHRVSTLRLRSSQTLDRLASELDSESRSCEELRQRYGHLWDQAPSSALPAVRSFRADLKAHRESLDAAERSDQQARGMWEEVRGEVRLLAGEEGGSEGLERRMAEVVAAAQSGGKGAGGVGSLLDVDEDEVGGEGEEEETRRKVEEVSEALARLNRIKKERGEVMRDLKEKVQADDISHILILNRKSSSPVEASLFATELEKFRPHQQRLTQTLSAQQSALADVNAAFSALSSSPKAKAAQGRFAAAERAKREFVARLGHAAQAYADVRTALGKGIQFYGDLGELVDGLEEQVKGFLSQRTAERERARSEAEIKQRLEGGNGGGAGGLDRAMGGLSLGAGGATSPPPLPPSQPSWSAPSPQPSLSSAYPSLSSHPRPSQPSPSPYSALPTTGVFGLSSPAAPPPPPQPPRQPTYPGLPPAVPPAPPSAPSPYSSSSYSSPPPPPPAAPSPYSTSSYSSAYPSQPPQHHQQRQGSLPPPPAPVSYASYSSSSSTGGVPPPPAPVSYRSYGSAPPPPPPQPQYGSYGQPQQQQYGQPQQQQQQQYGGYGGYGQQPPPQPPTRPY
ncbi:hypothetical protein JCM8547_004243 [Rhodosporidiobolus lusitaniae]